MRACVCPCVVKMYIHYQGVGIGSQKSVSCINKKKKGRESAQVLHVVRRVRNNNHIGRKCMHTKDRRK